MISCIWKLPIITNVYLSFKKSHVLLNSRATFGQFKERRQFFSIYDHCQLYLKFLKLCSSFTIKMGSIQEVTFEDDSKNTFFILCTPGKVESWREDKSVNLMSVLQVYDVYTRRRTRGEPARPSKGELE